MEVTKTQVVDLKLTWEELAKYLGYSVEEGYEVQFVDSNHGENKLSIVIQKVGKTKVF